VLEEDEREHGYPGTVSADDVRSWWRRTKLDENSWALERDGAIVALGWLEQYGDEIVVVGVVRPGKGGEGLGSMLVDIGERRGRELGGTCFRQITLGADNGARALFEARDYRAARRHYVMAIVLDSDPPEPELPDDLQLGAFRDGEERAFQAAGTEAFANEWGFHALPFDEWWAMRKDDDHSLWFVIRDRDEMAAVARCEPMLGGGSVGMLAVRERWRRRGLGRALLLHAFREFRLRGWNRATLGVDSENPTGATRLYESVGMRVESEHVTFEKAVA
jgi:mycothiol synthase